jgi:hypothetical protein
VLYSPETVATDLKMLQVCQEGLEHLSEGTLGSLLRGFGRLLFAIVGVREHAVDVDDLA